MTKMINCFVCGSWLKPNKHGTYKCPKCKAKWKLSYEGVPMRIYENSEKIEVIEGDRTQSGKVGGPSKNI